MSLQKTGQWGFSHNKASRWTERMWMIPRSKKTKTLCPRTSILRCRWTSEVRRCSISLILGTSRPFVAMNRRHTTTSIPFTSTFEAVPIYNLPGFPTFNGIDVGHLTASAKTFWQSFCQHQDLLAGYIRSFRFDQFEFGVSGPLVKTDLSVVHFGPNADL